MRNIPVRALSPPSFDSLYDTGEGNPLTVFHKKALVFSTEHRAHHVLHGSFLSPVTVTETCPPVKQFRGKSVIINLRGISGNHSMVFDVWMADHK